MPVGLVLAHVHVPGPEGPVVVELSLGLVFLWSLLHPVGDHVHGPGPGGPVVVELSLGLLCSWSLHPPGVDHVLLHGPRLASW